MGEEKRLKYASSTQRKLGRGYKTLTDDVTAQLYGLFLSVLESVWDTLHFLYRHMYTMKMEAVVSTHFRCFHPVCGNVILKKESLRCINLQCNKYFLGKSQMKMS